MFVVQELLKIKQDATNIIYEIGKKTLGRQTVESTEVLSKHLFSGSCSDLPYFTNKYSIKKQEPMDKKNLSILRKNWAVAELQVSYKPKTKTGVEITSSEDAYQVFIQMWDNSLINLQEQFCAIFLNKANQVIAFRIISTGKLNSCNIDIQLLLSCALISRAAGIIVAHNHPSGNLKISRSDKDVTTKIKEVAEYLELNLIDHLIITDKDFISFSDNDIIIKSN